MRHSFFLLSSIFCFTLFPREIDQPTPDAKFTGSCVQTPKADEDIYVSFDYFSDASGYQYGAAFYLYNPNDFTVNVQWQFVGSSNVNFSPTNSDRTTITGKTKVWITNVTSADHSKAWNSGKVQWRY